MAHNNTVDDVAGTEELDRASGGQVLIEGMEEHVFLRLCGCGWARDVLEECWLSPSFLPRIPEAHRNTPQKLYARALEWLFLRAPVTKIPPRYADRERDEAVRRQKGVTNVVGFANLDTHKRMRALLHAWGSEAGMVRAALRIPIRSHALTSCRGCTGTVLAVLGASMKFTNSKMLALFSNWTPFRQN